MPRALEEALLDVGIKHVNFFEGRILSGRDLRDQQAADRAQRQHLGRAIGDGVVEGFRITIASQGSGSISPVLHVEKGLAVNRAGQTLFLPQDEDVSLIRDEDAPAADSDIFSNCATQPAGTELPNGSGLYIFTVGPASGFQEEAPKSGLGDRGKGIGCGSRYATLGLRFRLLRFDPSTLSGVSTTLRNLINNTLIPATSGIASLTDPVTRVRNIAMLRNVVANLLLGPGPLASMALDPGAFGAVGSISPVDPMDDLRGDDVQNLTDCEVPLTILYWTVNGIEFLDTWSVRRVLRQSWDPASLSMPLGYGLERLLQFHEQVAGLNTPGLVPSTMRIEQHFRFLPPAAFYPAIGPGAPLGMNSSTFLTAFTSGQLTEASVGIAAEILQRSFLFPAVDLQLNPFLQQYSVNENEAATTAGDASQFYVLFVDRSLNGPAAEDGVWEAFADAWDSYRGLILRRVFLPVGSTADEVAARISIVESIRDVMDVATHHAARAGGWTLDRQRALNAYERFHEIQRDFATLLSTGLASVPDTQSRVLFATGLLQRLDTTLAAGAPGLEPSVQASNLIGAVAAQNEINQYVGQWSGEGVAVGPFVVDPPSSPDGLTLVPGAAAPFRHRFVLRNGTDRRLRFNLTASTLAPSGTWEGSTTIRNLAGSAITFLTLDSDGSGIFEVRIQAPGDAVPEETATLRVTATAPPPTSRSQSRSVGLPIDTAATDPVTSAVTIESAFEGDDPASAGAGELLNYVFNFVYTRTEGPSTASFDFFIFLSDPDGGPVASGWDVGINDGTVDERRVETSPDRIVFRKRIASVTAGANRDVPVLVLAGPAGTSVEMRVAVRSADLATVIENELATVIEIDAT